jgi:hypothetical protein
MHLEQVKSFKYLGSIVNGNNSKEEEIKERIILGSTVRVFITLFLPPLPFSLLFIVLS